MKMKECKMKKLISCVLFFAFATPAESAPHHCAGDAVELAKELLRLHFASDEIASNKADGLAKVPFNELPNWSVDEAKAVKQLPAIRALKGNGKFDVLEVQGFIYKATYRMHFIFAQGDGCTLMGQEILEESDPY
jgi:hypothetical protein